MFTGCVIVEHTSQADRAKHWQHINLVLGLDGVIDEAQTMLILFGDPPPFRNALKEPRHAR